MNINGLQKSGDVSQPEVGTNWLQTNIADLGS